MPKVIDTADGAGLTGAVSFRSHKACPELRRKAVFVNPHINLLISAAAFCGLGFCIGMAYVRHAKLEVTLAKTAGYVLGLSILAAVVSALVNAERCFHASWLGAGICLPIYRVALLAARLLPFEFSEKMRPGLARLESLETARIYYLPGKCWTLVYRCGTAADYNLQGKLVEIRFPDGSQWEFK
ncbi:MAG: hypothetical protein K2W82_16305 [Candidatus Obscuribacterales bacterium]|nr:hypothetical protein [Candidatus Obscuribacterales bacterium]